MNNWLIAGIILLVLGIIAGNILLLKYSAKMPFKPSTPPTETEKHND